MYLGVFFYRQQKSYRERQERVKGKQNSRQERVKENRIQGSREVTRLVSF
jgi:hypothetical protein